MDLRPHLVPIVLVTALLGVGLVAEHLRPAFALPDPRRGGLRRWARNLALAVGVLVVHALLVPVRVLATEHGLLHWADRVPLVVAVVVTVVVLDLVDYGYHLAAHRTALWRFHQVHHLDNAFDVTTTLRIHPVDFALGGLAHVPVVVLLGLPVEGIVVYSFVFLPAAVFHHSGARLSPRVLEACNRVVVTPRWHMTHHEETVADTNSNYASILTVWDRLFGTANAARRTAAWRMGVDYSDDLALGALLALPFHRRQDYATGPLVL